MVQDMEVMDKLGEAQLVPVGQASLFLVVFETCRVWVAGADK